MPEAMMVFVLPPSDEELLRRLRSRAREGEAVIQRRFQEAQGEIELARSGDTYDHFLVNDDYLTQHFLAFVDEVMQG